MADDVQSEAPSEELNEPLLLHQELSITDEYPTVPSGDATRKHVKEMLGRPPQESALQEKQEEAAEDEKTAEAVDDIVSVESDTVLAAEDKALAAAFTPPRPGLKAKFGRFFHVWWSRPLWRWLTISGIVLGLAASAVWPTSRYYVMNTAGLRSSASMIVLDETSQQPLKNVHVQLAGQATQTADDGSAKFQNIPLGRQLLKIEKRAYATADRTITIGWGSNPLGNFSVKAVGSQYTIVVKDYLSGKPMEKVQASSGEANASSDKNGKIILAVDPSDAASFEVTLSSKTFRDEKLTIPAESKAPFAVVMVPARKEVFVSKRSGRFDLYKTDVDGKNESVVLKGTGFEQDSMAVVSHPSEELVAFVSTRDNAHNSDGFLLSSLQLINLTDNSTKVLATSERIQVKGWIGDKLVYVLVAAGASAANLSRNRIVAYDYKTGDKHEIVTANYFNDVTIADDVIYYAPANVYENDGLGGLYKINADGNSKQTISTNAVWTIFRSSYDSFNLAVGQDWFEYKLGSAKPTKLSAQPAQTANRSYVDNPSHQMSLWVDQRDGKGVLLAYDTTTKTDKTLKTQSGITDPVRWLNDKTAVYRIRTDQETADYALSLDGGEAKRIVDVTNTTGINSLLYY